MTKIVELLKEQRELEFSHAKALQSSIKKIRYRLVKALLESIIHDSNKHATLCQALVDVDAGTAPVTMDLGMGPAVEFHQDIKQHVRVEAEMIRRLEEMMDKISDDRVNAILEYLLADERRHHATLLELSNLLDRDTAPFEEYLDLFQKFMVVPP